MEAQGKLLSQDFADSFGCWFDSDLIDVSDHSKMLSLAWTVVDDLIRKGATASEIIGPLTQALTNWGPTVVDEFDDASNGAWSFDADMEELLRDVVREMIATARNRDRQATDQTAGSGQAA